jgi:hypothetical protein
MMGNRLGGQWLVVHTMQMMVKSIQAKEQVGRQEMSTGNVKLTSIIVFKI